MISTANQKRESGLVATMDDIFAVVAEGLVKKFGKFIAVDGMSFKVKKGEIFGFLGPNGAGKSTTIRMLCGILTPTEGKAIVGGLNVATQPDEVKNNIGYMSQKFSLYQDLTVEQNIVFYGGVYGLDGAKLEKRKRWVLEMAGLKGKEKVLTHALSAGWKQRLALGCSMLHQPPILFLDEPTAGVDPLSRRSFWDLIYELSDQGVTVFVTTHYMDEAEHCNTIGLIYNGKLTAIGSPTELKHNLDQYSIFEVFCKKPVEAMESLRALDWVIETSIFGSAFHISTHKDKDVQSKIQNQLAKKGIVVDKIDSIIPSLEDVFIHLITAESKEE